MQRSISKCVACIDLGSQREYEIYGVDVASLDSQVKWSVSGAVCLVYIETHFYKHVDQNVDPSNSCEMQSRLTLGTEAFSQIVVAEFLG